MNGNSAHRALERLAGTFLDVRIEGDLSFRFSGVSPEREDLTAQLERAYRERRGWVIELVTRSGAARAFADAFRLKGGEP
jgi:hypothetical protein